MPAVTRVADLKGNPNPIDPDVKIPEAVRKAAEAAEAAQRAAYPDQTPADPAPKPPTNPDTIVIADPPAPAPAAPVTPVSNEPPPAPQPAPTPAPTPQDEDWKHKFNSEHGRRQRLEVQLAQSNDRIALLEASLEELKSRPMQVPPAAPTKLITEQEESEFGAEMLDVMGRRAKEIVSPELAELRNTVARLTQQLEGTTTANARTAKATMLATMDSAMPDWRQINVSDEFKSWLALPDKYFGASRQSALTRAYEQNDTERVLNFFRGFVSELAAGAPATPSTVDATPAKPPARPSLEDLAAPGRARTSAQPDAPAEKQIITTADIDAFYAAVRRGDYRGREAEKEAHEQELFRAQREGRVRTT